MQKRAVSQGKRYLLFNKPFRVLCQFSQEDGKQTLADYVHAPDVYPAGRLDFDSEGLVFLTDDGPMQHRLTDPRFAHPRTYWVQVEGEVSGTALQTLQQGVVLDGKKTRPCQAIIIGEPPLPERVPPVRQRKNIPTSWIQITLREGRNRQVRRMTAAAGFPTLRLIRSAIGQLSLDGLTAGQCRDLNPSELAGLEKLSSTRSYK